MKLIPAAATVGFLIVLLTWLSLRAVNPEAEGFDHAFTEIERFGMVENGLYRDVFAARAGTLRNYDPLVREIRDLRVSLDRLRGTAAIDVETTEAINRLAASVDQQEDLVEHFKSQNALLHNSLSFFGRTSAKSVSPELDPVISAAAAAILNLTLDTSSVVVQEAQNRLDDLDREAVHNGQGDAVESLLAHGRLVARMLPSVDGRLRSLAALPNVEQQNALRAMILKRQSVSREQARQYRRVLYGLSLVLVAFLVQLALGLRKRSSILRRRSALEHVIAAISMRFLEAQPHGLDEEIDRAVAAIGICIGADRIYLVTTGARRRLHVWHKPGMEPPPGWPERAPEMAARIGVGGDGIVHVARVSKMPPGEDQAALLGFGLGGWACATTINSDGTRVLLGFDVVGRPCGIAAPGELSLARTALDTIVHALERHTVEMERARLESRLRQATRMEKIGIFTSGIAHNFNNILGGILGHAEVMADHVGSNTKLVRNLAGIRLSAERARDLIDEILGYGRRRDVPRKLLNLCDVVGEVASLLEVSLPSSVELAIRHPEGKLMICGEPAQLQQVILNLCNNAAHAMPDGGRIEIAAEQRELRKARPLSHDEIGPGRYVCITVTDNGSGMDELTLTRIFEPFFTTRSSGNGLGLATAREIAREHGGVVSVQSKPGEGSRFEVWLPEATAVGQMPEPDSVGLPAGAGETVMLVAGSERLLRDEELLAALGYEPVGFATAEAALAASGAHPDRFDMVVVGHLGPIGASLELAAALHAALPAAPIVLARTATEIDADTLVSAGISDVVRWPIVAEEIAVALARGAPRALCRVPA
ncbi:MAG: two-component system VirA-like sensor kinase [Bradyrhizobium sp.]|uniref:two-component system VirA-like sensor kinase n=1 Tax=Bradyrhizobium sp. TaxID=376 RepID=UPI001D7EE483|nr:two-component system VirA-like sensor kinase [Bradyrhizobium sp.]MBV9562447.1 two-component system VirA-like sensor kinase [Bradyrhizobium sp.]